jgi:hypothetical protein
MRAQFIKETLDFKRNQDPKRSMGVGMLTWEDIQDGTILYSKAPFAVTIFDKLSRQHTTSAIPQQPAKIYFVIDNLEIRRQGITRMRLIPCYTLKEALEFRKKILDGEYIPAQDTFHLWGYDEEFPDYFDIVQRSQLE